jgi:hypothetical protein
MNHSLVYLKVLFRHPLRGKSLLKYRSAVATIDVVNAANRFDHFVLIRTQKPSRSMIDDLPEQPMMIGHHWCAAPRCFDSDQSKGLGVIWAKCSAGIAKKVTLLTVRDLTNELD